MAGSAVQSVPDIGWYNGWSPAERCANNPIQNEAVREGLVPRPTQCSICAHEDYRTYRSSVWFHDEDYARPLESYWICRRCHWTLHQRFEQPEAWYRLIARFATGSAWFEQLSMDPGSRFRPFCETYPNGIAK